MKLFSLFAVVSSHPPRIKRNLIKFDFERSKLYFLFLSPVLGVAGYIDLISDCRVHRVNCIPKVKSTSLIPTPPLPQSPKLMSYSDNFGNFLRRKDFTTVSFPFHELLILKMYFVAAYLQCRNIIMAQVYIVINQREECL